MKAVTDFCIERCLQIPTVTHAFLQLLIDETGVELSVDHNTLTHEERVCVIRGIIADCELREAGQ